MQRYFSYRAILVAIALQNYFVLLFIWVLSRNYRAIYMQNGVSRRCACLKLSTKKAGGIEPFRGTAALPEKVSRNMLAWLPLQSLAVKKNFFLCKFWAVKNF